MVEVRPMNKRVKREHVGGYIVSTVRLPIEHWGMWYETLVFPADDAGEVADWGDVAGTRYATKAEARIGHAKFCDDIRSGTLEMYG